MAELTRVQALGGHDITVMFSHGDPAQVAACVDWQQVDQSRSTPVPTLARTFALGARAARTVAVRPYDLLHVHGDFPLVAAPALMARRRGVPVVVTVHSGLSSRYVRIAAKAFANVDQFIALGERARASLQARGIPEHRITVMSSGLNVSLLRSAPCLQPQPGVIVAVGSLDPMKGFDTLIRSVLALPERHQAQLQIIGEGPCRTQLERIAAGSDRIRFLGSMSRSEVYARLAGAELFVMASRALPGKAEGVPTALLEAMAMGLPCIASTDATPAGAVRDDASYRTFIADDVADLTQQLLDLLSDDDERRRLGVAAAATTSGLSWERRASDVEEVYARALARSRP